MCNECEDTFDILTPSEIEAIQNEVWDEFTGWDMGLDAGDVERNRVQWEFGLRKYARKG